MAKGMASQMIQARQLEGSHGAAPLPKSVIREANQKARERKEGKRNLPKEIEKFELEKLNEYPVPGGSATGKGPGAKTLA